MNSEGADHRKRRFYFEDKLAWLSRKNNDLQESINKEAAELCAYIQKRIDTDTDVYLSNFVNVSALNVISKIVAGKFSTLILILVKFKIQREFSLFLFSK